jgi:hypothetical protein
MRVFFPGISIEYGNEKDAGSFVQNVEWHYLQSSLSLSPWSFKTKPFVMRSSLAEEEYDYFYVKNVTFMKMNTV